MTSPRIFGHTGKASLLMLCLVACTPEVRGQSVSVEAGNLRGSAQAGTESRYEDRAANCNKGVTVRSANGSSSASASVSSSGGGESVVAGAGSPGSSVTTHDCSDRQAAVRSRRNTND
jgi:hypothetical protein